MKTFLNTLSRHDEVFIQGYSTLNELVGFPLPLAYVVLLICHQGDMQVNVNFQTYTMQKNDFLVLAEDSIVVINHQSDDFYCAYYLMNRSIAAEVAQVLPNSLFLFLHKFPHFKADHYDQDFFNAWEKLAALIANEKPHYNQKMVTNHFQNLFLWISQDTAYTDGSIAKSDNKKQVICWAFWELIALHYKQQRDVAFYAKLLHITPYYLSQLTKQFFNDSPKTLIDRQIVLGIKKQLLQSTNTIQQIADDFNFSDASYLGKYFKRLTGMGLTEYRKLGAS